MGGSDAGESTEESKLLTSGNTILYIFFSMYIFLLPAGKMAQWVKALNMQPKELIWIPGTQLKLEGKLIPHSWPLFSTHILRHLCAIVHAQNF